MAETKNYILRFNTNLGEVHELTVPYVNTFLTPNFTRNAMNKIVSHGIFEGKNGFLVSLHSAECIIRDHQEIEMT